MGKTETDREIRTRLARERIKKPLLKRIKELEEELGAARGEVAAMEADRDKVREDVRREFGEAAANGEELERLRVSNKKANEKIAELTKALADEEAIAIERGEKLDEVEHGLEEGRTNRTEFLAALSALNMTEHEWRFSSLRSRHLLNVNDSDAKLEIDKLRNPNGNKGSNEQKVS